MTSRSEAVIAVNFPIINRILHAIKEPEYSFNRGPVIGIVTGHQL
jgi:hypothetical protein